MKVTISRHWNNPKITSVVTEDSISLSIDMKDFFEAVIKELDIGSFEKDINELIGPIAMVFRKSTFDKLLSEAFESAEFKERLEKAFKSVLKKMKEESIKVV